MDKIVILAIIALAATSLFGYFVDMFFAEWRARIHDRWLEREAERKRKAEEAKKKAAMEKYCKVYIGNPIIESIIKSFNIIIYGSLGTGKSLFANLLAFYILKKQAIIDKKMHRQNSFIDKQYLLDLERLEKENKLRVYSTMDLCDCEGRKSNDLIPYLLQEKKVVKHGVEVADELATFLGKARPGQESAFTEEGLERIYDSLRYNRQNGEIYFIGTEHDKENIIKPAREKGFLGIQALRTYVSISRFGQLKNYFNKIGIKYLPGILTYNWLPELRKRLFKKDRWIFFLKLLIPQSLFSITWFGRFRDEYMGQLYYINKAKSFKKIENKHKRFKVIINLADKEFMFNFGKEWIFDYNTNQNREQYEKQFDEEGNNKWRKQKNAA